jgi:branched-chain amino acid transport system permease protein
VIGAFTIVGLQNFLSDRVGSWINVIIGVIFVVCVVAFRRGFVGELLAALKKRSNYTAAKSGKPSSEAR